MQIVSLISNKNLMEILKPIVALSVFVFSMQFVIAQKPINEATLTYNISVQSVDGKTDLTKSLEGATLTVYLKGSQSRSDMTSALGVESNLFDSKTGKGYILKEYSGQKLMITMD